MKTAFGRLNQTASGSWNYLKTHLGGGKMFSKKTLFVLATLLVVIVSLSVYTTAMAAALISCDSSGKCVVRLDYYNWPDYEENIVYGFQNLGHGQNEWVIPTGRQPQSFGSRIGTMELFGYKTLMKKDGSLMKALGVCDVASIVHYVAELNGLESTKSVDGHVQLPVLPVNPHYANSIFEDNSGLYTQDLGLMNTGEEDATIRWTIVAHVLTIWVEGGNVSKEAMPPVSAPVVYPTTEPKPTQELEQNQPVAPTQDAKKSDGLFSNFGLVEVTVDVAGVPVKTTVDLKEYLAFDKPLGQVIGIVVLLFLGIFTWGFWYLNRQNSELRERLGVSRIYVKSRLLGWYFWFTIVFFILYLFTKDEAVLVMTKVLIGLWVILQVREWGKRVVRHLNLGKHIPWYLDLTKDVVLVLVVGGYSAFVFGFSAAYIPMLWQNLWAAEPAPYQNRDGVDTFMPLDGVDWQMPLQDIPTSFAQKVMDMRAEIKQIALEEDVPPEVLPTIWLKESSGTMINPENGEGVGGFQDLVASGTIKFPPGKALSKADILAQLRLIAKEFKKKAGSSVNFSTTDLSILGPVYMAYNGNIDCHGKPFSNYTLHPYVMNGWDSVHSGMIARDGKGGCVPLVIIGALPAHVRIGAILRSPRIATEESQQDQSNNSLPPFDPSGMKKLCADPLGFCGFALRGGPGSYIQGTVANGGNGLHCNLANECGWDWWDVSKASSAIKPINVLSMLNGKVTAIGVYADAGTPYLEITNASGRKQAVYHCDKNYVAVGDIVTWGQSICLMGNQGRSSWTHLHLVLLDPNGSSVKDQTQWWPK